MTAWDGAPWTPRRWQAEAVPAAIAAVRAGQRPIVSAWMGSGKAACIAELARVAMEKAGPRAIVVAAPTQHLVRQLAETVATFCGPESVGVYYGPRKQPRRRVIVTCFPSVPNLHADLTMDGRAVALAVIDECHGSERDTLLAVLPALRAAAQVGFSATPFRSVPREGLSLWDTVCYRYSRLDAERDVGVCVPLTHIEWRGADVPPDEAMLALMDAHARGPGVLDASSIADADACAAWLTARGWPALPIHSNISERDKDARLAMLQAGDLRAVVHVNMLAEGVDLPWLAWLGIRRRIGARVRLIQQIGRVLRAHPGKTTGVVLDPLCILGEGAMGLDTTERLEAVLSEITAREAGELSGLSEERVAVNVEAAGVYVRRLRLELEGAGIVAPSRISGGSWRDAPATEAQIIAIYGRDPPPGERRRGYKSLTRYVPSEHREQVRVLAEHPRVLTRGQVSDLIDVLLGGRAWAVERARREGRPDTRGLMWDPSLIDLAPLDVTDAKRALKSTEKAAKRREEAA